MVLEGERNQKMKASDYHPALKLGARLRGLLADAHGLPDRHHLSGFLRVLHVFSTCFILRLDIYCFLYPSRLPFHQSYVVASHCTLPGRAVDFNILCPLNVVLYKFT